MNQIKTKIKVLIFAFFNLIYKIYFPLYKILYFWYKQGEKGEINFFRKKIKKGMDVVDVGANIGFYTVLFSKLVGRSGKVYAFEPDKKNFKFLQSVCKNLQNTILINKAVGDKTGSIRLYESNLLNVDHVTYKSSEKRGSYPVDSVTLDDYFKNKKIDFVKIDTQGFEYQVLNGMKDLIKKNKKISILCEFQTTYIKRAGKKVSDLLDFFKQNGLKTKIMRDKDLDWIGDDRDLQSNIYATRV
jgi:FkbM family methyltransferase